jgi:hypothetical protein
MQPLAAYFGWDFTKSMFAFSCGTLLFQSFLCSMEMRDPAHDTQKIVFRHRGRRFSVSQAQGGLDIRRR